MLYREEIERLSETDLNNELELVANALQLEKMVLSGEISCSLLKTYKSKNDYWEYINNYRNLYEKYETCMEYIYASSLLQGIYTDIDDYLMYNRFKYLIRREIKLANIQEIDNVLFVGSGPFPLSAILMNRFVGCPVCCCERNEISASISEKVIRTIQSDKLVSVINCDGKDIDVSKYTLVIVAVLAKPKIPILYNINNYLNNDMCLTKNVIVRTSHYNRQLLYEPSQNIDELNMHLLKVIIATGNQTISSMLFERKSCSWKI